MATRRRSRKPTPLKELLFLSALASGLLIVTTRVDFNANNLMAIFGAILFFALLAGVGLYLLFLQKQRVRRKALRAVEMADVDGMTGLEFEKYVAALLSAQGYKTKMTPINDYGVDIIAVKDGERTAVQVKRYSKKLDQKSVREAVTGKVMKEYRCTQAMVVTNSTFTPKAKELAAANECVLVDREALGEWILGLRNDKVQPEG